MPLQSSSVPEISLLLLIYQTLVATVLIGHSRVCNSVHGTWHCVCMVAASQSLWQLVTGVALLQVWLASENVISMIVSTYVHLRMHL